MSPRAYDLVGDVTAPAEIFPRLDALKAMADTLAAAGHADAAEETRAFLKESNAYAALAQLRIDRLRLVWKSVEMTDSSSTSENSGNEAISKVVVAYRELPGS